MARNKGLIVAFSGLDGAGKSTQIRLLQDFLLQEGYCFQYLWTRGGYTPVFEGFKSLLRRVSRAMPAAGPSPQRTEAFRRGWVSRLWMLLAMLELLWVYGVQLRWWRRRGNIVLCDRYLADTAVDFRINFPQEKWENWRLWRMLQRLTPAPDVAFLLVIPVAESVRRSDIKGEPFRDSVPFLKERWARYGRALPQGAWHILNGGRSRAELATEIISILSHKLSLEA